MPGTFYFGAAIGASIAAVTGGNIGKGALTGAISGAIFGGIGSFGLDGFAQVGAHVSGGAVAGAVNTTLVGGDIVQDTLIGAFSAGAAQGFNQFFGDSIPFLKLVEDANTVGEITGNSVKRAVIGAALGGTTNVAFGGSFTTGAKAGFITAGIAAATNSYGTKVWNKMMDGFRNVVKKANLSKSDPRVKGAVSFVAEKAIHYATDRLERGRLRGSLKVAGGIFSALAGVNFATYSAGAAFVGGAPGSPIPLQGRSVLFGSSLVFGAFSYSSFQEANTSFSEGFDEVINP